MKVVEVVLNAPLLVKKKEFKYTVVFNRKKLFEMFQ